MPEYMPTCAEVALLRELIITCREHQVVLQPETRFLMIGRLKIMKITDTQACLLGGKGDRTVVCTVTPKEVIDEIKQADTTKKS